MTKVDYLDDEERDLDEALKGIDFKSIKPPSEDVQNKFKGAAKSYLSKGKKMNVRISQFELNQIKRAAESEGLRYQTFVKSVLHKYITGRLIEKPIR